MVMYVLCTECEKKDWGSRFMECALQLIFAMFKQLPTGGDAGHRAHESASPGMLGIWNAFDGGMTQRCFFDVWFEFEPYFVECPTAARKAVGWKSLYTSLLNGLPEGYYFRKRHNESTTACMCDWREGVSHGMSIIRRSRFVGDRIESNAVLTSGALSEYCYW